MVLIFFCSVPVGLRYSSSRPVRIDPVTTVEGTDIFALRPSSSIPHPPSWITGRAPAASRNFRRVRNLQGPALASAQQLPPLGHQKQTRRNADPGTEDSTRTDSVRCGGRKLDRCPYVTTSQRRNRADRTGEGRPDPARRPSRRRRGEKGRNGRARASRIRPRLRGAPRRRRVGRQLMTNDGGRRGGTPTRA